MFPTSRASARHRNGDRFVALCLEFEEDDLGSPEFLASEARLFAELEAAEASGTEDFDQEFDFEGGPFLDLYEDLYDGS